MQKLRPQDRDFRFANPSRVFLDQAQSAFGDVRGGEVMVRDLLRAYEPLNALSESRIDTRTHISFLIHDSYSTRIQRRCPGFCPRKVLSTLCLAEIRRRSDTPNCGTTGG